MSKPTLLLFAECAERMLDSALFDRFEIIRLWEASDPDALIAVRGTEVTAALALHLDADLLDRLPNLRLVVVPGAGDQRIAATARSRGIRVANADNADSADVADHAVALVLASLHRIPEMQYWVGEDHWNSGSSPDRRQAMSAQRFGIVGLGNIGRSIAGRLAPFGGELEWWGPRAKSVRWSRRKSLIDLAHWCTILIVAVRGDAGCLIDSDVIAAVGPDGLIVNVSRGDVIDEAALIAALKERRLGRAALDVFAHEPAPASRWRDVPNVILTPHVGGISEQASLRLREVVTRNLMSLLDGTPLVNDVTGPHSN